MSYGIPNAGIYPVPNFYVIVMLENAQLQNTKQSHKNLHLHLYILDRFLMQKLMMNAVLGVLYIQ